MSEVKINHWELTYAGYGDSAELRLNLTVPKSDRVWGFKHASEMEAVIASYIEGRTKSRWQRVWEAIR